MFTLPPTTGAPTTLRALRFVSIRLSARPDTADLVPAVEAARARLQAAAEAAAELEERSAAATAEVVYQGSLEDAAVAALGREARVLVEGRRTDPRWTALFPQAPSQLVRLPGADLARELGRVVALLRSDPALAALAHHAEALQVARAAVEAAQAERAALALPALAAQVERRQALEEAHRVFNRLRPQLQLRALRPAQVRSFFPRAAPVAEEAPARTAGEAVGPPKGPAGAAGNG